MRYFSMFSGIGGFELGIKQAYELQELGIKPKNSTDIESRASQHTERPFCIGYSEIDPYAIKVYEQHFPTHKNYGNATTIDADGLPDFDLLVGGFPCQAFSIAGKRKGFEDTRGTLFFEIARILRAKQPRNFILENVKGLLSHDNGQTFKTIIATLAELGYCVEWQVLNSKNHGVPQNRERVYIVGHLGGQPTRTVFPIGETHGEVDELQRHISNTLTARYEAAQATGTYIGESELNAQKIEQLNNPKHSNDRVYAQNGISPTLNTMQGGNRQPFVLDTLQYKGLLSKMGIYASTQEKDSIKKLHSVWQEIGAEAFAEWGLGILDTLQQKEVLQQNLHGGSFRQQASEEKPSMDDGTLSCSEDMPEGKLRSLWKSKIRSTPQERGLEGQFIEQLGKSLSELPQQNTPLRIRRLTPMEAERLQGFPDNWTAILSDTRRYKAIGNAVTVNVVKSVMERLLPL